MGFVVPSIYRHIQDTAASVWTVQHNLAGNGSEGIPIIDVFITENGVLNKIIPGTTTIVDRNTVTIQFAQARSGEAVVIV